MIKIETSKLSQALKQGMDEYLQVITDAFLEKMGGKLTAETMSLLNADQHTLLAYRFFCDEMREGGFVQLIQNGYGGYIFENPFAKAIKQYGAGELSKLIYKAKEIYDANKIALERETTEEEFNALYVDFEQFDDLEEIYFDIEEAQTSIIFNYVRNHIGKFIEAI